MIEQVAWNKTSLLLKNILLNTHKHYTYLQSILSRNYLQSYYKMPSRYAWVERSKDLLKEGGAQALEELCN
jgi:hypothetical protein